MKHKLELAIMASSASVSSYIDILLAYTHGFKCNEAFFLQEKRKPKQICLPVPTWGVHCSYSTEYGGKEVSGFLCSTSWTPS